jgi:hypothetical protein
LQCEQKDAIIVPKGGYMLTENPAGFIAENGNNIYVVSIDSDLAVLRLYDYIPDLEKSSTQSPNAYAGMIFGAKTVYVISPDMPTTLAICWYIKMVADVPEAAEAMQRFLSKIARAGMSRLN